MPQSPQVGENRTGIQRAGTLGEEMRQATVEFPPSSEGSAEAIANVRVAYAREGETLGEMPPTEGLVDRAKSALAGLAGGQPAVLMDKLGERLAFERAGARLYEALLSKHQAFGTFDGGPSADDLLEILHEEYTHGDMLAQAIEDLGGDPTVVTPSANVAAVISAGLPQVLTDPRANLLQSLEAVLVAELTDNECWTALEQLARQGTYDELADNCREAIAHERDHLRRVRRWVAAGQGRAPADADGAGSPDENDELAEEFTFAQDSPVDAEGFVVSDEEQGETGEQPKRRPARPKSRRRR